MPSFGAPAVFGFLEEDERDELGTWTAYQISSRTDLAST